MTTLQNDILKLRNGGKSYGEIQKLLKCSKGSIAYSCSPTQKKRAKKRAKRHSTEKGAIYKKLQGFCYNYGKSSNTRKSSPMIDLKKVKEKFGNTPKCYLTGESIDLSDMSSYSLDHINPLSRGGKSTLDNMGLTTKIANQSKSGLTREEFIDLCIKVLRHNSYSVEYRGVA